MSDSTVGALQFLRAQKLGESVELQFDLFCRIQIWSFLDQGTYRDMLSDSPNILGMFVKDWANVYIWLEPNSPEEILLTSNHHHQTSA